MSQTGLTVRSHWHLRCEQITVPVMEFYELVKQRLTTKKIPNAVTSMVSWKEGGIASAERDYLRISLGRQIFDVCTAPYADGSFFSCWAAEKRPSPIWGISIIFGLIAFGFFSFIFMLFFGFAGFSLWASGAVLVVILIPVLLANLPHEQTEYIWVIPGIGPFLEKIFSPTTYYRIDTSLMAESAVYEGSP